MRCTGYNTIVSPPSEDTCSSKTFLNRCHSLKHICSQNVIYIYVLYIDNYKNYPWFYYFSRLEFHKNYTHTAYCLTVNYVQYHTKIFFPPNAPPRLAHQDFTPVLDPMGGAAVCITPHVYNRKPRLTNKDNIQRIFAEITIDGFGVREESKDLL